MLFSKWRRWIHRKYFPNTLHDLLLVLHNRARAQNNARLVPLLLSESLCWIAQEHCRWMAYHGMLSHNLQTNGLLKRLHDSGVSWYCCGENLHYGFESEIEAFRSSFQTPSHRQNILRSDVHEIGFGEWKDAYKRTYLCTIFSGSNIAHHQNRNGHMVFGVGLAKGLINPKLVELADGYDPFYPFPETLLLKDLDPRV